MGEYRTEVDFLKLSIVTTGFSKDFTLDAVLLQSVLHKGLVLMHKKIVSHYIAFEKLLSGT